MYFHLYLKVGYFSIYLNFDEKLFFLHFQLPNTILGLRMPFSQINKKKLLYHSLWNTLYAWNWSKRVRGTVVWWAQAEQNLLKRVARGRIIHIQGGYQLSEQRSSCECMKMVEVDNACRVEETIGHEPFNFLLIYFQKCSN